VPPPQVLASGRTWSELSPALRGALRRHSSVLGTFKLKGVEAPQEVVHLADELLALRPYLAPRWAGAWPAGSCAGRGGPSGMHARGVLHEAGRHEPAAA
jgi:hypothetical protein